MSREFRLPDLGEGLTEAEIVAWRVAPGDAVAVNDVLAEVETAKAAVELPSPFAGTVAELLVEPGRPVAVGTPIVAITTTAPAEPDRIPTLVGYGPRTGAARRRTRRADPPPAPAPVAAAAAPVPLAKPPVRKLARDLGVDLRAVTGSGPGGVITREDVHAATSPAPAPTGPAGPGTRREPVTGVRRATAAAMVASAFTAPHVTVFLAADVTATMQLRDRLRATREYADVPLTALALIGRAVCLALRRTPVLNASWDDAAGEIVHHDRVHLGIAAATPRGLLVPVVRDADTLALRDLAAALRELTTTARAGRTTPADLRGGTFTITNVGVFGVDTGTPILVPGQAGILAVGAIRQAPWVVDGALAVRTVCQLGVSFDHRLVDGEQGARFLADVGALLTDPGLALTW